MITAEVKVKESLEWVNFFAHIHHEGKISRVALGYSWERQRFARGGVTEWLERDLPGTLEAVEGLLHKHGPLVDVVEVWFTREDRE